MEQQPFPSERLAAVWKRVQSARPKLEGSAQLMPRGRKEKPPRRPPRAG
jgi:hypothetical protein